MLGYQDCSQYKVLLQPSTHFQTNTKLINGDPVSRSEYKKLAAYDRHQLDLQKQQFNSGTATNKQKGNYGEMCADYYIEI